MVLEPVKYKWAKEGRKKSVKGEGYVCAEVPGLVIGVFDWRADGFKYRYYEITHAPTGFGFHVRFIGLSTAARFLTRLGRLCDWREVAPGNELYLRVGPVVGALKAVLCAQNHLERSSGSWEDLDKLRHPDRHFLDEAEVRLEAALETFRGRA